MKWNKKRQRQNTEKKQEYCRRWNSRNKNADEWSTQLNEMYLLFAMHAHTRVIVNIRCVGSIIARRVIFVLFLDLCRWRRIFFLASFLFALFWSSSFFPSPFAEIWWLLLLPCVCICVSLGPFDEMYLFCIHAHTFPMAPRKWCVSVCLIARCPSLASLSLFLCSLFFHHFYLYSSGWASSVQQIAAWQSSINNNHNCCWMRSTTSNAI